MCVCVCVCVLVERKIHYNRVEKHSFFSQRWVVLDGITFLDVLVILLHCDLICLPIKFIAYPSYFLIQLLITHYCDTVHFFMKTFLNVYNGFQSYFILYTNLSYGLYWFPIILHPLYKPFLRFILVSNHTPSFIRTFLTVYIGFQSYSILYTNLPYGL